MNTLQSSASIAIVSFTIGTLLFLLQLVNVDSYNLPVLGFYYVCMAVLVNLVVILVLFIKLFLAEKKVEILKAMGIILVNAPIAFIYTYILFEYSFI